MGSRSNSTVVNTDNRLAVTDDALGIATHGSGNVITVTDRDAVSKALDFASQTVDAVAGEGFQKLLSMMTTSQDTSLAQLEAIRTATNDKEGVIDQKTMLIGGAIVLAFVFFMRRRT